MSLHEIQTKVHVAKSKTNTFGGYNYRTAEGILSALKSILIDGETIIVDDDIVEVAGQIFVSSTATLTLADGSKHSAKGHAMHPLTKKGMDPSQITGTASSYARKYALGGLLALDDGSVDPDAAKEPYQEDKPEPAKPDQPAVRDRIKTAIEKSPDAQKLDALWKHPKTCEAFEGLHPAMQGELTKAYTDRKNDLYREPEAAE